MLGFILLEPIEAPVLGRYLACKDSDSASLSLQLSTYVRRSQSLACSDHGFPGITEGIFPGLDILFVGWTLVRIQSVVFIASLDKRTVTFCSCRTFLEMTKPPWDLKVNGENILLSVPLTTLWQTSRMATKQPRGQVSQSGNFDHCIIF